MGLWFLIGCSYGGVLVSIPIVAFIPFNLLKAFQITPATLLYRIIVGGEATSLLVFAGFLAVSIYRRFIAKCLEFELILLFLSVVIAVFLMIWLLPIFFAVAFLGCL